MREKTLSETKANLDKYYSDSAPWYRMVQKWFIEFRCERTSTESIPSPDRPNEIITPKIINRIHDIVLNDPKVKLRNIAEIVSISTERVVNILYTRLCMKKFCARRVVRSNTIEQKFVTMNETWIHQSTPESRRGSKRWLKSDESASKRSKTQQLAEKVMASVFRDAHGVIFINYLEKERAITKEYYAALLARLVDEIRKKRPHFK